VKPFLLLATRFEDEAADDEYAGFLAAGGLTPDQLHRVRLEAASLPSITLGDYSGVIVGGSPFNASDPADAKSGVQRRVEGELAGLLAEVVAKDYPFLGACYGIGLLSTFLDGVVDETWSEPAGPIVVSLTDAGGTDQLFGRLAPRFEAFVGHKEACTVLPSGAVLLATGEDCPVQAFRVGQNVYATQFHPELTQAGILTRLRVYHDNGYFEPDAYDDVIAAINASAVTEPATIMKAFVERFATA
jgi:GMP synthase (glutamine-hydrolysing)